MPNFEINIIRSHPTRIYSPIIKNEVTWTTGRQGEPGKLEFTIVKVNKQTDILSFNEGDAVRFRVDGKDVFWGYVFTKKRNKDDHIEILAYDQLRYFKNKDSYSYVNKTATQVLQMIAADFHLQTGSLENTKYVIPSRVEDNQTLFDIIQNALDETLQVTGNMYVLYDDFGKLCLRNSESMKVPYLICNTTAEDFEYQTSIDDETYNQIKLVYTDTEGGQSVSYIAKDSQKISDWGLLQYYETVNDPALLADKAQALLNLYNRKTRKLSITNAFGDLQIRAGSILPIHLYLGDIVANQYLMVEEAKHIFTMDSHLMDLTLTGSGRFIS